MSWILLFDRFKVRSRVKLLSMNAESTDCSRLNDRSSWDKAGNLDRQWGITTSSQFCREREFMRAAQRIKIRQMDSKQQTQRAVVCCDDADADLLLQQVQWPAHSKGRQGRELSTLPIADVRPHQPSSCLSWSKRPKLSAL